MPIDRTPRQVIESIVANLEMAIDGEQAMANETWLALKERHHSSRAGAFREALALIRTEAATILEAQS